MKPEAQIIAIAKACGWKRCHFFTLPEHVWIGDGLLTSERVPEMRMSSGEFNELGHTMALPRYLDDIKAMHKAVDHMNATQPDNWNDEHFLQILCGVTGGFPHRATAAQWANAFLRTLGLWKPAKRRRVRTKRRVRS